MPGRSFSARSHVRGVVSPFPVGSGGRPAGLGRGRAWTAPVLADSPCPASVSARPRPEQGPSRGTRLPGAYGAGVRPEPPSSIFAEDERMLGEETAVNAGRGDAATRRGSLATPRARTHAEQRGPAPRHPASAFRPPGPREDKCFKPPAPRFGRPGCRARRSDANAPRQVPSCWEKRRHRKPCSRAAAGMARRAGDLPGLDERIHGRQSGRDKSNSGRSVSRTRRGLRPREERRGRSTAASENGDSVRRVTSARAGAPRVPARRASCDLTLSCSAPGCEVSVLHARGSEAQELQDDAGHPKGA